MKHKFSAALALFFVCSMLFSIPAYATGDPNVDGGGGGMGSGTSTNSWTPGMDGVRVTVVRASDHAVVTTPIDLTNKSPTNVRLHFGAVSKLSYTQGRGLSPSATAYTFKNPAQALPRIVSSGGYASSIAAIRSYFTDEQVIRSIAGLTGMDFDILVGGDYKLLIEPIAYYKFEGVMIATTATEAAMYDEQTSGLLRRRMVSLTHKNLPLAMFLETADLGYPAWTGSRTTAATNATIKSSLGLGVVKFNGVPAEPPAVGTVDYVYRVNTEVITAVEISGGQSDPDNPVSVTFNIGGKSYHVGNVYYPEGDGQLAWVRWTTPATEQTMTIHVSVSGGGSVSQGTLTAQIVDLDKNPPPDPQADDRNDAFHLPPEPMEHQQSNASWGVWRPWWQEHWVRHGNSEDGYWWCDHGWWEFDYDRYEAYLRSISRIEPDKKNPTATGNVMKSGYGINEIVTTEVRTNQSSATTGAQTAVTYFPEFNYETYWRLLEATTHGYSAVFEFQRNPYSTYNNRTHFVPIWYPDGSYTVYTVLMDCWTPGGMLSQNECKSVSIRGNLWQDWHIAPQKPD